MNSNRTEIGSGHLLAPFRQIAADARALARRTTPSPVRRARAGWRLTRGHGRLRQALCLTVGSALAIAAAGTAELSLHLFQAHERHASVAPLAPAPAPPRAPVVAAAPRHRLLRSFPMHPLAGFASWYGSVWNGRKTASGETFDESQLTAAHCTLPLGTIVRVTNLRSMRSVIVRINDRGAFSPGRIIDLSSAAAREIGMVEQGLAHVKLEVLRRH